MLRALDPRSLMAVLCAAAFALSAGAALAQSSTQKPAQSRQAAQSAATGGHQATELGRFRDWGAFASTVGRGKVCYALSEPKSRSPANLRDTKGFLFISTRTAERVRNEIALVMNFDLKEDVDHELVVGQARFALVAKGQNLWIKNPAEEARAIEAMRRGSEMTVRGTSRRNNPTADRYSLAGFSDAVDAAAKECS